MSVADSRIAFERAHMSQRNVAYIACGEVEIRNFISITV
jgi:hypothetical protein